MKLKNLFIVAAIMLLTSWVDVFAQEADNSDLQVKEEGRVEYSRHWWLQVQAGAAHTIGEAPFGDLVSPAAALNVGYQFSPVFGVRIGASGWEARGSWVYPRANYKYSFVQGNADAVLNLSNLFCGWNPTRFFNGYGFIGVGFNHAFDNDEAQAIAQRGYDLAYLWSDSKNFVVGRAGLGVDMRLSDRVSVGVEVNANLLSDHFNSKRAGNADWHFNALVGVKINLGRTHKVIEPVYYEPEPIPEPEPAPEPVPEPEVVPTPVNENPKDVADVVIEPLECDIFFTINSSKIRSREQEKVARLVEYMKQHPEARVQITGYADKATGNAAINMRLSQKRADAVAKALQDAGIPAESVSTDAKGDTEQPFPGVEQNRVSICIATVEK